MHDFEIFPGLKAFFLDPFKIENWSTLAERICWGMGIAIVVCIANQQFVTMRSWILALVGFSYSSGVLKRLVKGLGRHEGRVARRVFNPNIIFWISLAIPFFALQGIITGTEIPYQGHVSVMSVALALGAIINFPTYVEARYKEIRGPHFAVTLYQHKVWASRI